MFLKQKCRKLHFCFFQSNFNPNKLITYIILGGEKMNNLQVVVDAGHGASFIPKMR